MTAQELRIGNIVGFKNRTDLYCVVKSIYSPGIHVIRYFNSGEVDDQPEVIEDITPIPLTEDWLLKFGFKKGTVYDYSLNGFGIYLSNNDYNFELPDGFGGCGCQVIIKHVHQLQNLYFALTGEELIMKENEALPE